LNEPTVEEVVSIVSAVFQIKGVNQNVNALQIEIENEEFKQKFAQLAKQIESKNLIARLEKNDNRVFVIISRFQSPKSRRVWIPRALFTVTIVMVMIDGYYHTISINSIIYIGEPFQIAILFTISLMGILGIHELGHMIASKMHKIKISWPYFIPGIPVFGFPTFGALIMSRSFTVNRDTLFDIGISGPIAGLIITVIVSTYGAYLSPLIPSTQALSHSGLVDLHSSIFMDATILLVGKHVIGKELLMSPILYAAWFGFLITFLNLLPAWQLDGGHIARATFGRKVHKITTYASIGVLAAVGYYIMAIFVLMFSMRSPDVKPLDDISPLSNKRKKLFILVIILAFLCAPLPFSILS
jgi:Zn-dependent protease